VSIIYDALQKTQKAREQTRVTFVKRVTPVTRSADRWKRRIFALVFLYVFVAAIVLSISIIKPSLNAFHPRLIVHEIQSKWQALFYQPSPIIPNPVIVEAEYKSKHELNGIFVSPSETVAMINNKMVHLGDTVDGMRVASIDVLGVQLRHDEQIIFLHAVM
jgi:hypothetical protein